MLDTVRIADIQTTDVLYYNAEQINEFYGFCETRDIDILPSIDSSEEYFLRNKKPRKFERKTVSSDMRVDGILDIFNPDLLEKFTKNPLLFVYKDQDFSGVIHFSDYNNPIVGIYLYNMIAEYERLLRNILIASGYNDNDMLRFLNKNGSHNPRKPAFQEYYTGQLIDMINHKGIIKINPSVNALRNKVMHIKDFVNQKDASKEDLIYKKETFYLFFNSVLILQKDRDLVKDRLQFLQSQKS